MILLNKSIIYIILYILLQFSVEVKSQTAFKPDLHYAHTATFINDKLYILGGSIPPGATKSPKETFLYLDVSAPFNTNELKWIDISNSNIVPPHQYAAAFKGGANNNTLFLYGGSSLSDQIMEFVYTFNTQSNTWSIPNIGGIPPTNQIFVTPIIDHNGLIYLFSGSSSGVYLNDMFILDTINLSLKKASLINVPIPRASYGAVLLPSKSIIYMGGVNVNAAGSLPLNEVYLYDTVNNIWSTKITTGLTPSARYGFSSVLDLDEQRVIIFGGFGPEFKRLQTLENSLYVLDINNFNWYIPKVTGKIPSSRAFHKTVLIGKYMIVTFGHGYTQGVENDILLLDISNKDEYVWTMSFVPSLVPSSSVPTSTPTEPITPDMSLSSQSNNTGVIVGAFIGSLIGSIALIVGSFFLYRRRKNRKRQDNAIPTPGESGYPQEILQIPGERLNY